MRDQDPTAGYRKVPKGPNFLLIVVLASVALLVVLIVCYVILGDKIHHMRMHKPDPTPNSLVQPLLPQPRSSQLS
jgi:hypothetical protein